MDSKKDTLTPPVAKIIPKKLEIHGDVRTDNYYWLNDRENPEVISYLNSENDYTTGTLKHTEDFQKSLFEEMKGRIKEDDNSVPYKHNGYWYITRYEKGKDYPIYVRHKETLEAPEELLFDCNEMAKGHAYFNLGSIEISNNNTLASFATDTVGRRQYQIQIKNLKTNEIYPDAIANTTGNSTWANDNLTLFYGVKDPQTLRASTIFKHKLHTPVENDVKIYFEKDDTFNTMVYKTKSDKYLVIASSSTVSNEYQILNADTPDGKFKIFQKRERDLEFSISHYQDSFYILTNADGATNFKLLKTPETKTEKANWKEVIPHRKNVLLEDLEIFSDYMVLDEREKGLTNIRIIGMDGKTDYYLPFNSETYTAGIGNNPDFNSKVLRYSYNSLTSPYTIYEYDFETKTSKILKAQEVLGGTFNKDNYEEKRIWAIARDGEKIPMSMVYKKGTALNGKSPLLLYAYGSYGITIDPSFSTNRLSLLDRGFIFVIAHIRGGEYLGRDWYENGKMLNKLNTFYDYIDCSKYLIDQNYTTSQHLYAMGGSAGGLLMGAVINFNAELYHGVIAAVPFVDVLTTMLDDTIPLTTGEYDEWGNPNEVTYYNYMKLYSPYDNVTDKAYPNLLVTTGLHDSQVQYWEPAKWVAKLRTLKNNTNKILLHTNMDAGHGGASGRFESLKEVALEYAFLLDLEGKSK